MTYPPIYVVKYRFSSLIKHPLEHNSSHHDGDGESWRSSEEQIVDTSRERHDGQRRVGGATSCLSNSSTNQAVPLKP